MNLDQYKKYAPLVLRIGISIVFLWFGISQLVNPASFLGYLPQFMMQHGREMVHHHPLQLMHNIQVPSAHFLIMGNGVFETLFGALLLFGLFTRISALLLSIHLIGITISLGYNDIAVRDFGLAIAAFSVFLNGKDSWSLDNKFWKKK